jgi:hypothetical protein
MVNTLLPPPGGTLAARDSLPAKVNELLGGLLCLDLTVSPNPWMLPSAPFGPLCLERRHRALERLGSATVVGYGRVKLNGPEPRHPRRRMPHVVNPPGFRAVRRAVAHVIVVVGPWLTIGPRIPFRRRWCISYSTTTDAINRSRSPWRSIHKKRKPDINQNGNSATTGSIHLLIAFIARSSLACCDRFLKKRTASHATSHMTTAKPGSQTIGR